MEKGRGTAGELEVVVSGWDGGGGRRGAGKRRVDGEREWRTATFFDPRRDTEKGRGERRGEGAPYGGMGELAFVTF